MTNVSKTIIYLDRQKIIFGISQPPTPITLEIPSTIAFDIEIIDPEAFENLLTTCLEQNKIRPQDIIIVLSSSVYYEKNIAPVNDAKQRKDQIDTFLTTVPFKNLFSKDYLLDNQLKLIALNKDFYEPIIRFFEKNHFNVIAIIPLFVLDKLKLSLVGYTPKEVNDIYKSKSLLPFSLISAQDIDKSLAVSIRKPIENKTRIIVLFAIFSLLFTVLLVFLYIRSQPAKPAPLAVQPKSVIIAFTPTPTSLPTTSYLQPDNIRIKIINGSGIPNQAAKIKTILNSINFKQTTTATSGKISGSKTQISYSPAVSPATLEKIKQAISDVVGDVTEMVNDSPTDFEIIITTISK